MADKIGTMSVGAFVALMVAIAVILIGSLFMLTRRRKSSYVHFVDEPMQRRQNAGMMPTAAHRGSEYDEYLVF